MTKRALVMLTAFVAIVVFGAAAMLYSSREGDTQAVAVSSGDSLVRVHSPVMGPENAPVTIVEFLDPSCEACSAFYPIVKQIMDETGKDVRLVLRYTPLHEGSDEAVRILEAARKQQKFQPVLEALFSNQAEWAVHGAPDIEKAWQIAAGAGLVLETARKDATTPEVDAVLAQDIADVKANRVEQTPTFFVNGKPLTEFSPQGLYDLVKAEIQISKSGS